MRAGMEADLIAVDTGPIADIMALPRVALVMKDRKVCRNVGDTRNSDVTESGHRQCGDRRDSKAGEEHLPKSNPKTPAISLDARNIVGMPITRRSSEMGRALAAVLTSRPQWGIPKTVVRSFCFFHHWSVTAAFKELATGVELKAGIHRNPRPTAVSPRRKRADGSALPTAVITSRRMSDECGRAPEACV
jgi:hypothetical protein